jgi:hypothetical protein
MPESYDDVLVQLSPDLLHAAFAPGIGKLCARLVGLAIVIFRARYSKQHLPTHPVKLNGVYALVLYVC